MNTNAIEIVNSIWLTQQPDTDARLAAVTASDVDVRIATSKQALSLNELCTYTSHVTLGNTEMLELLAKNELTDVEAIKAVCAHERIDRQFRRLLIADGRTYSNIDIDDQHSLALEMEPGPGLDDLIIGLLPNWVAQGFDFNVETLLAKAGATAGAQLLAATGPAQLSDERVLHWITNPPARWEHPDPERAWHQTRHVRDALTMAFTHRPDLAKQAGTDPELVRYAMDTPHWEAAYAAQLPGVDLAGRKLLDDNHHMPGILLSLVWNPKTPVDQAEDIGAIAEEAINVSAHSEDWQITAAAAESRLRVQQWHVTDYETITDTQALERLERRINSGFKKWMKDEDAHLNGVANRHTLVWPKRFTEFAALLTNPHATRVHRIRGFEATVGLLPEGTWTYEQFKKANRLVPIDLSTEYKPSRPYRSVSPTAAHVRIVEYAETEFQELPLEDRGFAWTTLIDLVIDHDECPSINVVETALALAS